MCTKNTCSPGKLSRLATSVDMSGSPLHFTFDLSIRTFAYLVHSDFFLVLDLAVPSRHTPSAPFAIHFDPHPRSQFDLHNYRRAACRRFYARTFTLRSHPVSSLNFPGFVLVYLSSQMHKYTCTGLVERPANTSQVPPSSSFFLCVLQTPNAGSFLSLVDSKVI